MLVSKKNIFILLTLFIISGLKAQIYNYTPTINRIDSSYLLSIPELPVSLNYNNFNFTERPYAIDNSQLSFFPPIVMQIGWECHIVNGIYYNLAYELNRIRNLSGNLTENQLPSHFVLNFLNEGEYANGPNIIRGWEMARNAGSPSVAEYGGVHFGGASRWMSGYEKYYHAIQNRVDQFYSIDVRTLEGYETLKQWLFNHLDEETGSLANCIIASVDEVIDTLAPGTEEEGRLVVTAWGPYAGHSITIVGYNDSIRYDYNNDGQYTNDLDINLDGVVNLKDHEIGGFKVANSFGTEWGEEGYAYMMSRLLAMSSFDGGLWANRVYILEARDQHPLLMIKTTLKHDSRNKIKISAGISSDITSTSPDHILDFHHFNYNGGDHFMQGGEDEEDKTIEIGLDITPLLSYIESGTQAKFFLMINENDPDAIGTGEIINFSIMDYTEEVTEIMYPQENIPLQENGLTTLNIVHAINYNEVQINTDSLETAFPEESYSEQFIADQGYPPYNWNILFHYEKEQDTETFPEISGEKLSINYGYAIKNIEFDFPFFDSTYNTLYLTIDGSIHLEGVNPYLFSLIVENNLYLKHLKTIMPFFTKANLSGSDESGIWYEGDINSATFRWNTMVNEMEGTEMNFAATLYPSGKIDFFYGDMIFSDTITWCSGISKGDVLNVIYSDNQSLESFTNNLKNSFTPNFFPIGMKISETGLFKGTPPGDTATYDINFLVKDSREIFKTKQIQFKVRWTDSILEEENPYLELKQNHPNPFSNFTWIDFSIAQKSPVNLSIYNLEGKIVSTLVNTTLTADQYHIRWDGRDIHYNNLPNGVYFYTLRVNNKEKIKKLIILK